MSTVKGEVALTRGRSGAEWGGGDLRLDHLIKEVEGGEEKLGECKLSFLIMLRRVGSLWERWGIGWEAI